MEGGKIRTSIIILFYFFKNETKDVTSILDEIAAKRSEIVNKTPFDTYDDSLALQKLLIIV